MYDCRPSVCRLSHPSGGAWASLPWRKARLWASPSPKTTGTCGRQQPSSLAGHPLLHPLSLEPAGPWQGRRVQGVLLRAGSRRAFQGCRSPACCCSCSCGCGHRWPHGPVGQSGSGTCRAQPSYITGTPLPLPQWQAGAVQPLNWGLARPRGQDVWDTPHVVVQQLLKSRRVISPGAALRQKPRKNLCTAGQSSDEQSWGGLGAA